MTVGESTPFVDYIERDDGGYIVMEVGTGIRAHGETPLDALRNLTEALEVHQEEVGE